MVTDKNYNVNLANLQDKKLLLDFTKETYLDEKVAGIESNRNKSLLTLLKSPSKMVSASGASSSH